MRIQRFGGELLALLQYEFIEVGQDGRVETDAVFYQKNNLHADFTDIMLQIHLVFNQLDDGYQQIGVSQPTENIVERTEVFVGNAFGDTMTERR